MSDFFEEKKQNRQFFRTRINKFLQSGNILEESQQFGMETLMELLEQFKDETYGNRIDLDLLYEELRNQEGGHILSRSTFTTLFGPKKQMKFQELVMFLKKYQLDSFNFVDQSKKYIFSNQRLNVDKLDQMCKKMKIQPMTEKGKQLLIQSFDFDEDGKVTQDDLKNLIEMINQHEKSYLCGQVRQTNGQ